MDHAGIFASRITVEMHAADALLSVSARAHNSRVKTSSFFAFVVVSVAAAGSSGCDTANEAQEPAGQPPTTNTPSDATAPVTPEPSGTPASDGAISDPPSKTDAGAGSDAGADSMDASRPTDPDPVFRDPFDPTAEVKNVVGGLGRCEGPAWIPEEKGFIFFNEREPNLNKLLLWRVGETGFSQWFLLPGMNHGNVYNKGIVYGANRLPGEIGRIRVSDKSYDPMPVNPSGNLAGKILALPNDLDRFSDGSAYFSEWSVRSPPANYVGFGIYRLFTDGRLERVISDHSQPNGIVFSADCRVLYTVDDPSPIYRYDVAPDGTLSNKKHFFTGSGMNGITVDSQGNVYASGNGGVKAINAAGEVVGTLSMSVQTVNLAFGGDDGKTLFITTRDGISWVRTRVRGADCNGMRW